MKTAFRPLLALLALAPAVTLARIPARHHPLPDTDPAGERAPVQAAPVVGHAAPPPARVGVVRGVWTVPVEPWYPSVPDPVPMRMPSGPEPWTPGQLIRRLFGGPAGR